MQFTWLFPAKIVLWLNSHFANFLKACGENWSPLSEINVPDAKCAFIHVITDSDVCVSSMSFSKKLMCLYLEDLVLCLLKTCVYAQMASMLFRFGSHGGGDNYLLSSRYQFIPVVEEKFQGVR